MFQTDHTSGLLKFVRKASQAVTNREPPSSDTTGPSSSLHQQHATSQQQQSGDHIHSQLSPSNFTGEMKFVLLSFQFLNHFVYIF